MLFDTVIGNPPYQRMTGGGITDMAAVPVYNDFVSGAEILARYVDMVIPARWFAGGRSLTAFREKMLHDDRLCVIHDYPRAIFPGTRIGGGTCYILWDRQHHGDCSVTTHGGKPSSAVRPLLEPDTDVFIRQNEMVSIYRKIRAFREKSFSTIISARAPYGVRTDIFTEYAKYGLPAMHSEKRPGDLTVAGVIKCKRTFMYVPRDYPFPVNPGTADDWKIFISTVFDDSCATGLYKNRLKPFIGHPGEVCTETYLQIGPFPDKQTAENALSYMKTKLFYALLMIRKVSHHASSSVYSFIPLQDFSHPWTDAELYAKYGLAESEIEYVERISERRGKSGTARNGEKSVCERSD